MQAWRVGDERAETYLRLLAEAVLRRAGDRLRALDAAAGTDAWSDPGMAPFATAEGAQWKVGRAGRILVVAGALDEGFLDRFAADLYTAINARSRFVLSWHRRRGMLHRTLFPPPSRQPLPSRPADRAMRVTPLGRALRVASGRAPWALHLMSLVRTRTEAVITVVMRMHWPPDGPGNDLEITGAGPHHLPYDQLWAVDDQGTRYTVRFEGGQGGTATWRGIARLSPVPPPGVRRLDLVGDGTRLIQLPLGPPAARGLRAAPPATGPAAIPPGERLLVLAAERILASGDARGPVEDPGPGEIITVLTEAGAIAADSPVPGQLASLCQRLGAAGHGITVPPAEEIPAPWASVIAHRDAPVPADGPEVFAPLAGRPPRCRRGAVRPGRAERGRGREPPARDQQRHAAAHRLVRVQLDAGFLLVAQGRCRELARDGGRRAVDVRGRHAGVPAAADAAARRGPRHGRGRGDRTGGAGPRNGTDSASPGTERRLNVRNGRCSGVRAEGDVTAGGQRSKSQYEAAGSGGRP